MKMLCVTAVVALVRRCSRQYNKLVPLFFFFFSNHVSSVFLACLFLSAGQGLATFDNQFRVMCVAVHPGSPEVFLCGGYSTAVKAWDSRCSKVNLINLLWEDSSFLLTPSRLGALWPFINLRQVGFEHVPPSHSPPLQSHTSTNDVYISIRGLYCSMHRNSAADNQLIAQSEF